MNINIICWQPVQSSSRLFTLNQKYQPHGGARWKPQSLEYIRCGPWMTAKNCMAIYSKVVQIFQSGPKWFTDQMRPCEYYNCCPGVLPGWQRKRHRSKNFWASLYKKFQTKWKTREPVDYCTKHLISHKSNTATQQKHTFSTRKCGYGSSLLRGASLQPWKACEGRP